MDQVSTETFLWPHTRHKRKLMYEFAFLDKWLYWASLVDCLHSDISEPYSFAMIDL